MTNVAWLIGWMIKSPSLVATWSPSILSAAWAHGAFMPTSRTRHNAGTRPGRLAGPISILFFCITNLSFRFRHGIRAWHFIRLNPLAEFALDSFLQPWFWIDDFGTFRKQRCSLAVASLFCTERQIESCDALVDISHAFVEN